VGCSCAAPLWRFRASSPVKPCASTTATTEGNRRGLGPSGLCSGGEARLSTISTAAADSPVTTDPLRFKAANPPLLVQGF